MGLPFDEVWAAGYIDLLNDILADREMPVRAQLVAFTGDKQMISLTDEMVHVFTVEDCDDLVQYCNVILREEGFRCLDYAHCSNNHLYQVEYRQCYNRC